MPERRDPTTDAVEILHQRYYEGQSERLVSLAEERVNAEIARQIYDLRTAAGLTQKQLAKLVGTPLSIIDQLEEADYAGNTLAMMQRIADALGRRLEIRLLPVEQEVTV